MDWFDPLHLPATETAGGAERFIGLTEDEKTMISSVSFGFVDDVDLTEKRPAIRRAKMPCSSGASASRFMRRRPNSLKQASGIHRRRRRKIQW